MENNSRKVGDIVVPNKGPHKGVKHKIIAIRPDGKYNVQPMGLPASSIKYRLGAVAVTDADLNESLSEGVKTVPVSSLKKGDKLHGSKLEIVSVSAGARTPAGKMEVTVMDDKGRKVTKVWGKHTKVGVVDDSVNENQPATAPSKPKTEPLVAPGKPGTGSPKPRRL